MSVPCPELTTPATVAVLPLTRRQVTCTVNFAEPSKVPKSIESSPRGSSPEGPLLASSTKLGVEPPGLLSERTPSPAALSYFGADAEPANGSRNAPTKAAQTTTNNLILLLSSPDPNGRGRTPRIARAIVAHA